MKEIFAGNDWVKIVSGPGVIVKPSKVFLTVTVSMREIENASGVPTRLGAVTAIFSKGAEKLIDPMANFSIPFVFSDDRNQNAKEVGRALKILIHHIPAVMRCANRIEPYECSLDLYNPEWDKKH